MIFRRRGKDYLFDDNCPQVVIDLFLSSSKTITYEFYKKYHKFFPKTKRFKITGNCESCNKKVELPILHLEGRTLTSLRHEI